MPRTGEMAGISFQRLPLEHKQARVDDVFRSAARRYDLMNDLISGGLHRAWKDALVTAVDPPRDRPSADADTAADARPFALLDLAGGTGDIAFRVVEAGGAGTRATVVDINAEMLAVDARVPRSAGWTIRSPSSKATPRHCRFRSEPRRRHHRLRHPQCAARRVGAGRSLPRAADRRPLPLPRVLSGRRARPRGALRLLLLQRHPRARPRRRRRRAGVSLSVESIRRFPAPQAFADAHGRLCPRLVPAHERRTVALHSGWRL